MKRITLTLLACFLTLSAQASTIDQLDVAKCAAISWFNLEYLKKQTDTKSAEYYTITLEGYTKALKLSTNERLTRTAGDGLVQDLNATKAHSTARGILVDAYLDSCTRIGIY